MRCHAPEGDPCATAVNHFSELTAHVSKENMLRILYKNTTDSRELVQLPCEVGGILCIGFSGR